MEQAFLGIDISKQSFHVSLLITSSTKTRFKRFSNEHAGFLELVKWIGEQGDFALHACMEATGIYGDNLAAFLFDAGHIVSVVNPAQIKGFGISELVRTKTDKADAQLIARFCQAIRPASWKPEPKNMRTLRALVKRLEDAQAFMFQERNRLESTDPLVQPILRESIDFHAKQVKQVEELIRKFIDNDPDLRHKKDLLLSIPGISDRTLARVLSFLSNTSKFEKAKQVSAFLGLNPKDHQSGTSVYRRGRISKTGNAQYRKWFYMPAMAAMRFNPLIKEFCGRLRKRGKAGKVVVVAAMKKLVHIIYGVLKNNAPYNTDWTKRALV